MTLFKPSFHELEDIFEIIQRDERLIKSPKSENASYSVTRSTSPLSSQTDSSLSSDSISPYKHFHDTEHFDAFYDDDHEQPETSHLTQTKITAVNPKAPKVCSICGEPTNCCHYDVPACSGCKTFFRRSVLSTKQYICKRDRKCEILKGERCRACRFGRCILSGMNPAAIKMPDNVDINSVLEHVNNHRKRILSNSFEEGSSELETPITVSNKMTPIFNQTHQSREIDFLLFLELKVQKLRESNYNPQPLYSASIDKILERKTEFRNCDKYIKPAAWPIRKDELERMYNDPPPPGPPKRMWMAIDIIICIEMAKTLPFFEKLETSDKLSLLKYITIMNVILTQCFYTCARHCDVLLFPDGSTPIRFGPPNDFTNIKYEIFCRTIEPIKRTNITKEEYVLLKTLIYCYPAVKDISDKGTKMLEKEFERYSQLLLNHMQAKMGAAPGAVKYGQVIAIIEALAHFGEKHREFHILFKIANFALKPELGILDDVLG